jgi:hypothetical protein
VGFDVIDSGSGIGSNVNTLSSQSATITITPVNDQPSFVSANPIALTGTEEVVYSVQISTALAGQVNDPDAGASLKGIAINWNQATSNQGVWAWSTDNSNWTDFPADITGSATSFNQPGNALYLNASDHLRFTPATNFNGVVSPFLFRLADNTMPDTVSGARVNVGSFNGSTGAMSAGPNTVSLSLSPVNDAPTLITTTSTGTFTEGGTNVQSVQGADVFMFSNTSTATGEAVCSNSSLQAVKACRTYSTACSIR